MMQGLPCSNGNCLPPASRQANLLNSAIDEDNVSGDRLPAAIPRFTAIRLTLTD